MTTSRDLAKLHTLALERFRLTAEAEEAQRARELTDLKFADPIDPEDQWPTEALRSRQGLPAQGSLPPVPPRPALTINKLRQPLQQVQNQQRQARVSLVFAPEGEGADQDTAEAFEDLARAIQRDSRAHLARNWAFDRALRCGRGFYRLETEYANDRSFDQVICYKRILNQFSVYFYPFCQEPDFSDAQWCFLTEDVPWPEYQRRYGGSALAEYNDDELTALGNDKEGWVGDTEQGKTVRIAEYYFFETVADRLLLLSDGRIGLASELQVGAEDRVIKERALERRSLRWAKLNGVEFLQEPDLDDVIVERDGRYIPVVPVIADESNINGERRYTGLVRPAMDAQRLFNVEASSLAEAVHLGPVAPYVGYATQFEGYEAWWAQLNTRRFPYLPVNPPRNQNEAALPVPQRNTAEQPIEAIVVSLQQADSYIKATTGIFDPSLGNLSPSDRSGKAILALQKQGEMGTGGYMDNLANMSILLEGKILRDLIPRVYDRPGRAVPAQGDDDTRRTVLLQQPFLATKQGPQAVQPNQAGAKTIDLSKGEYSVAVTVGKDFSTKREEAVDQMGALAQAVPQLVPAFADLWVKNMDGPGFRQIADRLSKAVPPQFRDEQPGQADPQQLQQQLQQAQQILQQLTQELNAKTHVIEVDAIKTQGQIKLKEMDLQLQQQKLAVDSETKITVAELGAKVDRLQLFLEERGRLGIQAHEATQAAMDRTHDVNMAVLGHQQALDQTAQQAALQPPPTDQAGATS